MNTFTDEELNRVVVDENDCYELTTDGPTCVVSIIGLASFAMRAFNLKPSDAHISTYAKVNAQQRMVKEIWFLAEVRKPNEHDRELIIKLSKNEGRLMFIQLTKGANKHFAEFIQQVSDNQTIEENRHNKTLWWSIMAQDSQNEHKNTYCLQGDVDDCKQMIMKLAEQDKQKYGKLRCHSLPTKNADFHESVVSQNKLCIDAKAYYIKVLDTDFSVDYCATAML